MILTEKQQKCQYYHQKKYKEILKGNEILSSNQSRMIKKQAKFTYFRLGKYLEI